MIETLALPVLDEGLAERLHARMGEVEQELLRHTVSDAAFVTDAARHLLDAGGKRVRPLLVLLAAETGDRADSAEVVTAVPTAITSIVITDGTATVGPSPRGSEKNMTTITRT